MKKILLLLAVALVMLPVAAQASLNLSYQFVGNGDWTLSGVGSTATNVGNLNTTVPTGSTIEKAFLYSSLYSFSSAPAAPTVTFGGTAYSGAQWTPLTVVNSPGLLSAGLPD